MPKRYVIHHPEMGVYLGECLGLGFWSKLDPVGQPCAPTFATAAAAWDAQKKVAGTRAAECRATLVAADIDGGLYASVDACARAGLHRWEP